MFWVKGEETRKELTENKSGVLGRTLILLADSSAWKRKSQHDDPEASQGAELIWAPG